MVHHAQLDRYSCSDLVVHTLVLLTSAVIFRKVTTLPWSSDSSHKRTRRRLAGVPPVSNVCSTRAQTTMAVSEVVLFWRFNPRCTRVPPALT